MEKTIPIVVGVTGHRQIREEDRPVLVEAVRRELESLKTACPHSQVLMLSSLAEGADQLCAEAALSLSIPVIAALPMEQEEFEKDFEGEVLENLRRLCRASRECFAAPAAEKNNGLPEREFAYRQAGIYVAVHSHLLLALWDGKESGLSCGTAETVRFALTASYCPEDAAPLRSFGFVRHIFTPRGGDAPEGAGTVVSLGDEAAYREILARTDEFNSLTGKAGEPKWRLLPENREQNAQLDRMEALYGAADSLSVRFAAQYRRLLALIAAVCTLITASFLLYDDAELKFMILVCGAMVLAAGAVQRFGTRSACHRRYLEYRTLAESLRVQSFLSYAGSGISVPRILPWSEQTETPWVAAAVGSCMAGERSRAVHGIRDCWVEEQRLYHEKALKKSEQAFGGSERVVRIALTVCILLYLAVLVFELIWGGLWPTRGEWTGSELVRTLAKLLLGSVSALTLFIANYYGKLSLSRSVSDHRKMEAFYRAVRDRLDEFGQSEELLLLLAREELVENANWCAYRRDNGIEVGL